MSWTYSPLRNMRAHVWVTDPKVEQVNDKEARIVGICKTARAYTREEFMWSTMWWYVESTGIPINIGLGLVSLIGNAVLRLGKVPFLLLWQLPVGAFVTVLFISILAALLGIWRITKLEPAIVFR